jgi:hypothetical protein
VGCHAPYNAASHDFFPGLPVIDWFCGDKPLAQNTWSAELSRLGVVVLEARSFLNLLEEGQAQLDDVDMLVCRREEGGHLLWALQ